jgi:hypothetical protein
LDVLLAFLHYSIPAQTLRTIAIPTARKPNGTLPPPTLAFRLAAKPSRALFELNNSNP